MWNLIIIFIPSCVLGHMNFERCFPSTMGMKPFLERFILNPFSIYSMYVDCERQSNPLDLSHRSLFPEYRMLHQGLSWRTIWTTKFSLLKSRNVIPILICHIHIYNMEYNYAPTNLPLYFRFILVLYKVRFHNRFIKTDVPTPICLLLIHKWISKACIHCCYLWM